MQKTVFALALAAALAACNPAAPGADTAPPAQLEAAVFPDLFQTAYRAEATLTGQDGATVPVVMIRSGKKVRMEMNMPQGQMVTVIDQDSNDAFAITSAMGRTMVIRQDVSELQDAPDILFGPDAAQAFTQVGPCSHIGETGVEWRRAVGEGSQNTCVTRDGIILWSTDNGRTTWQTTSVQRGAQDASLFAVPAGAQVMDFGQMQQGMSEALARAKAAAGQ